MLVYENNNNLIYMSLTTTFLRKIIVFNETCSWHERLKRGLFTSSCTDHNKEQPLQRVVNSQMNIHSSNHLKISEKLTVLGEPRQSKGVQALFMFTKLTFICLYKERLLGCKASSQCAIANI